MSSFAADAAITVRPLQARDLEAVVAIDAGFEGRARREYVERRLRSAQQHPELHVQFAAVHGTELAGYMLAKLTKGDFGRRKPSLRIEMMGLRPALARSGAGRRLFEAVAGWAQRRGASDVRTVASWKRSGVLGWLSAMGFELGPDLVVESRVGDSALWADRDGPLSLDAGQGPASEVDFGRGEGNDQERHARLGADVRTMTPADLDAIVRIDREKIGVDRREYLTARLVESEVDRSIRASLCAHRDGTVVGYLMARADLGDFGRPEPVAVIDVLAVDGSYAHRGIGRALMRQLFANLGALRVEAVESSVPLTETALLGFLVSCGFRSSPRLVFRRPL
ncbi:MAG TPA: GNAT family N-acetyltransferase [Rubrivivax sp.]|nr:GNAT family N-acetyltransferase [Burkholderiales bacterium]HNU10789.1 GNAT family N-acetyltransferase [Rubrivivax sp.]